MPRKPLKPCLYPGCPNLSDQSYCPVHRTKQRQNYDKYQRDPNAFKTHGRTWRKVRAAYVAAHPLCEECLKHGKLTPVEEVHHIIPTAEGGTHATSNLMSLCHSCHEKMEKSRHINF